MTGHQAGIFSEVNGGGTWGWQCFTCHQEEGGFGTAKAAQEAAIHHQAVAS